MNKRAQFTYCPLCGSAFARRSGWPLRCKECGFHFFYDPHVAVAAIITNKKGEILFVDRLNEPKKGYWTIPGGFVNVDEKIEDALIREVKEEAGAKINKPVFLGSYGNRYLYQGINYRSIAATFVAEIDSIKFKKNREVSRVAFFSPTKIPWNKLAFPSVKDALKDYLKKKPA